MEHARLVDPVQIEVRVDWLVVHHKGPVLGVVRVVDEVEYGVVHVLFGASTPYLTSSTTPTTPKTGPL